ncbi:hypothetical protein GCM10022140_22210 [Rhodococcus aetherivorans]
MPTIETIIMSGKTSDIGLRAIPEPNISATMPIIAATITTGSSFARRFPGVERGISGGACILTSPAGTRGTSRRGLRTNRTVLTPHPRPAPRSHPTPDPHRAGRPHDGRPPTVDEG